MNMIFSTQNSIKQTSTNTSVVKSESGIDKLNYFSNNATSICGNQECDTIHCPFCENEVIQHDNCPTCHPKNPNFDEEELFPNTPTP